MRNPLKNKTAKKANGTISSLKIEVIPADQAAALLMTVKRQGIYRPYIPTVVESLKRLAPEQHIQFHTPQIVGRTLDQNCKRLMSVINIALKTLKINHRLRHVTDSDLLVSEPINWGNIEKN